MWNWQQKNWPDFVFDPEVVEPLERQFLLQSGEFIGVYRHVGKSDRDALRIDLISEEAVKTSEIEGEILNRASVQSSLRHEFGLGPETNRVPTAERGISKMMADLYENFASPLAAETMFDWHRLLLTGHPHIKTIGGYRTHAEAMEVISGPVGKRKVHFEAPPSAQIPIEMRRFIRWFNSSYEGGKAPLPPLTRAGLAHLYFVCIHPFEDGNGRIGRAIAEKVLAQSMGRPSLIALAFTIERKRKDYYAALEHNNKGLEITAWLSYFGRTVLEAQSASIDRVNFYIAKAKFCERLRDQLNARQAKAIARMFKEGPNGFKGGLSAENYISVTGTSRATATRDLKDLVEKRALASTGELRHTRYHLALPN